MSLRGKRWRKERVHWPDENKWTASWWEELRQRRRNWLNQSFILFPPICCAVIGVRVTGGMTPLLLFLLLPICLNTYTSPHKPSLLSDRALFFCFFCVLPGKTSADTNALQMGRTQGLIYRLGTQSLQQQWEVTEVILQLQHFPDGPGAVVICRQKTRMCRTQLRVLPTV